MEPAARAWLFDYLATLAEGIVAVAGPTTEVVVHDFKDLEHTVVAVSGNLTGRRPGAPVADLALAPQDSDGNPPDILNYTISTPQRTVQSSTVYIRDPAAGVIGAVCVNIDYGPLARARDALNRLVAGAELSRDIVIEDTFARNLDDLLHKSVSHFLRTVAAADVQDLTLQDKQRLVEFLEQRGLFKIRGTADKLAELLDVSRTTIYNYRTALAVGGQRGSAEASLTHGSVAVRVHAGDGR